MAWFRRNRDEAPSGTDDVPEAAAPVPTEPEPEPGAGSPATASEAEPVAAAAVAAAPAWTTAAPMPHVTPTIQRVLGRVDARASTTLGKPAPLCLAPLGHAVSADAPAGVISTLASAAPDGASDARPIPADRSPLEYVQRAPAGSTPPRPAPPAQLLVPSFQPTRLPTVPVAAPEVQRSAATPSYTTAPNPGPPLVLPVGEVLPPPAPSMAPVLADQAPSGAPLLADPPVPAAPATTDVQRAAAPQLPLAPVQRHADHPGHVPGDDAPDAAPGVADVQRAAADATVLADAPLPAAAPLTAPDGRIAAVADAPPVDAQPTPRLPLPLAPVQRHADHPGHVEGDEAPAEGDEVQRAAVDPAPPAVTTAPPTPSAPLVGDAAPLATPGAPPSAPEPPVLGPGADLPLPGAPVQRSASPRRPAGLGPPIAAVPPGAGRPGALPGAPITPAAPAPPAPLVGADPLQPTPALSPAAVQRAATEGELAGGREDGPSLDLAQRAPTDAGPVAAAAPVAGAESPTGPTASTSAPLVGEVPLGVAPAADAPEALAGGSVVASAPGTPLGLELVQRAALAASDPSAPSSPTTTVSTSSSGTTPVAASVARPPLVVAPLLGGRPFSTNVQRSPGSLPSAPAGLVDRSSPEALSPEPGRVYQPLAGIGMWNGAPPPDLPVAAIEAPPSSVAAAVQRATGTDVSNVRIRRDTGLVAQRLSARAFTSDGDVHIPAAVGSLDSGEGASLATHELVHAGQQSVLGSSRPHEHTPEGQVLEAQARSAEHASLAGLELPRMPLAAPTPAVQRAPVETSSSSPFSPQQLRTLIDLADSPSAGGTSVQRVETPPSPPPRPSSSAPALPPAEHAGAQEQTPQQLEELATKLFPTLRNLFRSELLSFRRRSGTSSDRPLI